MKQKNNNELESDVKHLKKQLIWWRGWTNRDYLISWCLGILFTVFLWAVSIIDFSTIECSEHCRYAIDSSKMVRVCDTYPKEFDDDKVFLINKAWEGCWLAVGEEDAQLYWKCDGFSAPIGVFVCSEEIAKEQLKKETKKEIVGEIPFEQQENIADCISGCLARENFDYCKEKCQR